MPAATSETGLITFPSPITVDAKTSVSSTTEDRRPPISGMRDFRSLSDNTG
jgi:hypothetical protein